MTKEELKILLRDFRNMKAQIKYLNESSINRSNLQTIFEEKDRMVRLIESAYSVLDKKELFIIENHLINHETWIETEKLMQDYFGLEYYRSDRTLKRMQNRALEKMVIFIKEVSDS